MASSTTETPWPTIPNATGVTVNAGLSGITVANAAGPTGATINAGPTGVTVANAAAPAGVTITNVAASSGVTADVAVAPTTAPYYPLAYVIACVRA